VIKVTSDALDHLDELLCDAADYADATGDLVTARCLRLVAGAVRRITVREHADMT
jgi:hypothetical protein